MLSKLELGQDAAEVTKIISCAKVEKPDDSRNFAWVVRTLSINNNKKP